VEEKVMVWTWRDEIRRQVRSIRDFLVHYTGCSLLGCSSTGNFQWNTCDRCFGSLTNMVDRSRGRWAIVTLYPRNGDKVTKLIR